MKDTMVILEKGTGKAQAALDIEIPDLWHLAMMFASAHELYNKQQATKATFDYPDEHDELDLVSITFNGAQAQRIKEAILDTWHKAHALKNHIIEH